MGNLRADRLVRELADRLRHPLEVGLGDFLHLENDRVLAEAPRFQLKFTFVLYNSRAKYFMLLCVHKSFKTLPRKYVILNFFFPNTQCLVLVCIFTCFIF